MLMFLAAGAIAAPTVVKPRIVDVSMFKNGYSVVTREISVPASGEYTIPLMPQSSLGTLWFVPSAGTQLDYVVSTNVDSVSSSPLGTLSEILLANVGRKLRLIVRMGQPATEQTVSGRLVSAAGDVVVVETDSTTEAFQKGAISRIEADNGKLAYSVSTNSPKRELRVKVESPKAAKVFMVSLERGLTWSPGYAVELEDDKKLTITAKATLMNDLDELDYVNAKFITGFPNIAFARLFDPLTSGQTVDQFVSFLQAVGTAPAGGGGFGGGGGLGSQMLQNRVADSPASFSNALVPEGPPGLQDEDLFFYKQPGVSLKNGDRAYYTLFRATAPYEHVYTWDVRDDVQNNIEYQFQPSEPAEIWHSIKFKNTTGQPLTTAAATMFKDREILGQDMMHYTSPGTEAELKITKALDVQAEASEEEVSRERGALKNIYNQPTFDLVTVKGTLVVHNHKSEQVQMRVTKEFTGELVSSDASSAIGKTANGLRDVNPHGKLSWSPRVGSGKSVTLSYSYNVYVRGGT